MDPNDPVLDQPQVIEFDGYPGSVPYRLANQDIHFTTDAHSDLFDLTWPWADQCYVKSIRMRIHDPHGEDLMALVTRYYAGYQETILGNEGMIISKRITVPLGSHYDRAAIWTLECQAEGDRLFRLELEIDWGERLTQRIVDGLLVAQSNPRQAQGIYRQRNADRTCVFGSPQSRPSAYEFDDAGRAHLTYYVLVNGIVDVPLLLTVSDVGEQVAWSGFLALRDAEREFDDSVKQWDQTLKTGRLWTSNAMYNRAVQEGKLECMRHVQRMRTGYAPATQRSADVPALVDCLDTFDVTMSRNLLAHLRRVAERSEGRIPVTLPVRPKDEIPDPKDELGATNAAYLIALHAHISRHPNSALLAKHRRAVALCAESLVQLRWEQAGEQQSSGVACVARGLEAAAKLAVLGGDDVNAARWDSEAAAVGKKSKDDSAEGTLGVVSQLEKSGWRCSTDGLWGFLEAKGGVHLAGQAIWNVCGLEWHDDDLWVYPTRMAELNWWALTDMPVGGQIATLVWDGNTLHSTYPIRCDQPVVIYEKIRIRNTEEHNFALQFDMLDSNDTGIKNSDTKSFDTKNERVVCHFQPVFDQRADE